MESTDKTGGRMRILAISAALILGMMTEGVLAQTAPTEVSLSVVAGRLVVPVHATSGAQFDFILSTGADRTIFSESGLARIGDPEGLTLGGLPVPTEETATLPDDRLAAAGKVFDGMVSSNMLSQFDLLIDVPGQRLMLKSVGTAVDWPGIPLSDPVRLRVFHGVVLSMDVQFNGTEYPAQLDLATPGLIVNEGVRTETGFAGDIVESLRVGSVELPDLPVQVLDLEIFDRWSPNGDGFVLFGAVLAHNCVISLSFAHQELRTCVQ